MYDGRGIEGEVGVQMISSLLIPVSPTVHPIPYIRHQPELRNRSKNKKTRIGNVCMILIFVPIYTQTQPQ